jgi:anti-sigma regulatory factor (Ser/Thr protein kinase)
MLDRSPAPAGEPVRWTYPPTAAAAGHARRVLRAVLDGWDLPEECRDDVLLVAGELTANAVDHAGTPFELTIRRDADTLHVAVADRSALAPVQRPHNPTAARGRGLQMVAAVARRWSYDVGAEGKTVWADVPI